MASTMNPNPEIHALRMLFPGEFEPVFPQAWREISNGLPAASKVFDHGCDHAPEPLEHGQLSGIRKHTRIRELILANRRKFGA